MSQRDWVLLGFDRSGGDDACWLWTRGTDGDTGYGKSTWEDGRVLRTHVIAWMVANEAEVPEGLEICHSCVESRLCGNPMHLRADTRKSNVKDMFDAGRAPDRTGPTHCKRGHEFTPENTYLDKTNRRHCRACQRLRKRGLI